MTFSAIEKLIKGSPVEFYEFKRGAQSWRYTSSDVAQSYNGQTFDAGLIKRSKLRFGGGLSSESVTITLPRNNTLAHTYIAFPAAENTSVTIYGKHRSDTETVVLWIGRVKNAEFKSAAVDLLCESIMTAQKAQGLRRTFGAPCSHALYDQTPLSCNVVKELYKVAGTVQSVSGNSVVCPAFAGQDDGYWVGGLLEFITAGGVVEKRMMTAHAGDTVTLLSPIESLAAGVSISVYPGCDHSPAMCDGRFNNLPNYGGFPYMPTNSPFGGTMLF
ncbi:phage BR0599 family protein [Methylobacter marinus]|uniref:phage BR0599 family protein n=1 Tax=Methylobacter marinus TaxID=34058 RepID=UPI00037E1E50|nr:phage BR0599 family protein [Methylobacter marinus]